jgi:hypothetical protein
MVTTFQGLSRGYLASTPFAGDVSAGMRLSASRTSGNRYRRRWREAVRDLSTAFALLISFKMTKSAVVFGIDDGIRQRAGAGAVLSLQP